MKNYPALLSKIKSPKYLSKKTKDERTPVKAIRDSFKTIPDSVWSDPTKYWADFACGRGTIILELINHLRKFGHSDSHIAEHIYALDINPEFVNYTTRTIMENELKTKKLNTICADFETWQPPPGIKFNIVFNPAWNQTTVATGNGTGGNVGYWKVHYKKSKDILDEYLIIFCMKTILKTVKNETELTPTAIHLMTDFNYWEANGCWVSLVKLKNTVIDLNSVVIDRNAISKIILCGDTNQNWFELNGNANPKRILDSGGVKAIITLPNKKNNLKPDYGYVNPEYSMARRGPKFVSGQLSNEHTYFTTSYPVSASFMGVYYTKTISEAKKLELFVRNNQLFNAIHKKMRTKGLSWTLKYTKPFDISQIQTGNEIPIEWNLTSDEVAELIDPSYGNWIGSV